MGPLRPRPDLYFEVMRRFGDRFVPLGEIADVRFGVKTGCDAFFMPRDITAQCLAAHSTDREFRRNAGGAPRKEVESGKLRIVKAGDGSVHPIEAEYLVPELHSPMEVDRPVVRVDDLRRVVLLVSEPLHNLKGRSPWVWRYLSYGMTATFPSRKSQPTPLPERPTCACASPWYDLTALVRPGIAFWPMAQQYRHIIPGNPGTLVCNHRFFDVRDVDLSASERTALVAVLNSTVVGLWKNFYGRYTGTEGSLDTEVVDVRLVEVPNPKGVSRQLTRRFATALGRMGKREVGRLVEEQLMDCHTPERARRIATGPAVLPHELRQHDRRDLDDAVFELLGVCDSAERGALIDRLYETTARHFREVRVVEIEKMQQRTALTARRFDLHDLAADIWDAAALEDAVPLDEWIADQPESDAFVSIPAERPGALSDDVMFSPNTVFFGKRRKTYVDCRLRGQAELVARLAGLGVSGSVKVPSGLAPALKTLDRLNRRVAAAMTPTEASWPEAAPATRRFRTN